MARASIAKKEIEGSNIILKFSDDTELVCDVNSLSDEIKHHLMMHGASQKIGDSYSGEKDVSVARTKAEKTVQNLIAGEWKAQREGGGGGRISDLAKALAAVAGVELSQAVEKIMEMDKDAKKELRAHPKIKLELIKLQQQKAEEELAEAGDLPSF